MNPLLIAQGAKTVIQKNPKTIRTLLFILVLLIVFGVIRRWNKARKQRKFDKNEAQDPNQLAQQYRAASNPSGASWMINWDGTHEKEIEILAHQTKGQVQRVADVYRLKFDESLSDRLRKELSPNDFANWRNIVT